MNVAIIGAGLSGVACATRLAQAGHTVTIYDKGRVPGGRMSHRAVPTDRGSLRFDHGAPYFTARDPGFRFQVERWVSEGIVARWPAAGEDAWVGVPTMNAPVLALAAPLDVHASVRIEALRHDRLGWCAVSDEDVAGPFDIIVLALPAEQARDLIAPWDAALTESTDVSSAPCWTVMAAFEDIVPTVADVMRHRGILHWAGRDSAKPGRAGPECWVLHASADWSASHLEDAAESIGAQLIPAWAEAMEAGPVEPFHVAAHRWRYARSGRLGQPSLWNGKIKLGLCGDWLLGPRVECAWLSGTDLATRICAEQDIA